ncbi:phage major capsid protein [Anaerostipes sp. AF04-45]|uniref:phage major capsid protein n=1 Tax=Anaerostipes sp. AF04-45 TaxID=2292912 RepID=UPI002E8E4B4D|nr:phage major capsid protein [Anaerostipes sp. AF04-45]
MVTTKKEIQERAENIKGLKEQRAAYLEELQGIVETAETEERAMSQEEQGKFDDLEKKIAGIDVTIKAKEKVRSMYPTKKTEQQEQKTEELSVEERAFVDYLRGNATEERAEKLTFTDNGAVIPNSIMNKIIEKVVDICPVYQMADRYNVGGNISIPYYDEETSSITMAYADEFTELTSSSGSFKSIDLSGFLAGALTLVSKKLMNNSNFNVLQKVIDYMGKAIAKFVEHECLIGTADKAAGMTGVKQVITAEAANAITADELIDVQEEVPDTYQGDCIWIMNKTTRKAIRKLKDSDGNYLLNRDVSAKWGYTLLGKDVYCSDNMDKMEAGKEAIIYGDMSGLAVKVTEEATIEVLREKYATMHAVGVVAWMEIDTKVADVQKIAKLKMKAS